MNSNATNDPNVIPVEIIHYLSSNWDKIDLIFDEHIDYNGDDPIDLEVKRIGLEQIKNLRRYLAEKGLASEKQEAVINMLHQFHYAEAGSGLYSYDPADKWLNLIGFLCCIAITIGLGWLNYDNLQDGYIRPIWVILNVLSLAGIGFCFIGFFRHLSEDKDVRKEEKKEYQELLADEQYKGIIDYAWYLKTEHNYGTEELYLVLPQYGLDHTSARLIARNLK